jgi:hypothetical protein
MNLHPALRPDLAAAFLFAKTPRRNEPSPSQNPAGVLAELARFRFCK